jgi:Spy/CpxP family protein refolding chaperone
MNDFLFLASHVRRLLVMTSVLVASCCALWAQPDGPPPGDMQQQMSPGPSADREMKQLVQVLTLTQDQQAKVKVILTDQQQQIQALFKQPKTSAKSDKSADTADNDQPSGPEAMMALRTQMKAIRAAANEKIATLLDDTQKPKFEAWLDKRQKAEAQQESEDMPGPPPDGGDGPPPDGGGGPGGGPGGGGPGGGGPPGV